MRDQQAKDFMNVAGALAENALHGALVGYAGGLANFAPIITSHLFELLRSVEVDALVEGEIAVKREICEEFQCGHSKCEVLQAALMRIREKRWAVERLPKMPVTAAQQAEDFIRRHFRRD